jgi:DNA-nicking Smr family endonuclease
MGDDDGEVGIRLGALLEPMLHKIQVREPEPEPQPRPRYLDESELMALIFAHLDHENPRVCEGIEFERFEISARSEDKSLEREAEIPATLEQPATEAPNLDRDESESESELAATMRLELEQRIGATWTDDIAAVPGDWLERPQLTPAQEQLLARSRRRALATLNLRHLDRAAALRHLELFVHACQARRVRWCRVITGKGIGSVGEPVLKRAVLEWCRGPGRTCVLEWAPQLDSHGEWGVVVVRLSSARIGGTTAP